LERQNRDVTHLVTRQLFRPVGPKELRLILDSGWRRFPGRLEGQPIFYPVLTFAYAEKIARDWNVRSSGYGAVVSFHVAESFLAGYSTQTVGGNAHQEYWIPAEELDQLNDNIVGVIGVESEYGLAVQTSASEANWPRVYDIREDREHLTQLQKVSQDSSDFGLSVEPALDRTDAWWAILGSPELPKMEAIGSITSTYWGRMNDWLEFVLASESGDSMWTRQGDPGRYAPGLSARVIYTTHPWKKAARMSSSTELVISIDVEESDLRSAATVAPGPGGIGFRDYPRTRQ